MKLLPITSTQTIELCKSPPEFGGLTIFICSYPKSGTTWTQNIVYQLLSRGNFDFDHISEFAPFYEADSTWNLEIGQLKEKYQQNHQRLGYRIFNTHLYYDMLPHGSQYKYIYVIRDGKDVVCSFYYHLSNQNGDGEYTGSFKEFLQSWLNGDLPYDKWSDHLLSYCIDNIHTYTSSTSTLPTNSSSSSSLLSSSILYMQYEHMVTNIEKEIQKLITFLNLSSYISADTLHTVILPHIQFTHMKDNIIKFQPISVQWHPGYQFIRQGKCGTYRDLFTDENDILLYEQKIDRYNVDRFYSTIEKLT